MDWGGYFALDHLIVGDCINGGGILFSNLLMLIILMRDFFVYGLVSIQSGIV